MSEYQLFPSIVDYAYEIVEMAEKIKNLEERIRHLEEYKTAYNDLVKTSTKRSEQFFGVALAHAMGDHELAREISETD